MESYFLTCIPRLVITVCDTHSHFTVIVMQNQCSSLYLVCCGFSCPLRARSHCLHFVIPPAPRISYSLSHELKLIFQSLYFLFVLICFAFILAEEHGVQPDYHKVLSQHQFPVYIQTWGISLNSKSKSLLLSHYEKKTLKYLFGFLSSDTLLLML